MLHVTVIVPRPSVLKPVCTSFKMATQRRLACTAYCRAGAFFGRVNVFARLSISTLPNLPLT